MIRSMTGYGCASGESGGLGLTIEVRSVNNRYLDCSIRIPRVYTSMEDALKEVIGRHVSRGKVDVYVTIDSSGADDLTVEVNRPVTDAYVEAMRSLSEAYVIPLSLTAMDLARFQDVLTVRKKETDTDSLSAELCRIMEEAMNAYDVMRVTEGAKLREDICRRLTEIGRLTDQAEARSPETVRAYREKLLARMREVLESTEIEESRILTEAAIFADRVAVNEEIVRLRSHIDQLRSMLDGDGPVGRKMDFLVQEMNREANTLGSKGNDGEIARIVIDLKAEIEKIREQIQNIE
ncbi:MAG: YicC family protein [Oscillospiraceae bacterium]|nr:YicC family protein [Oscillospiraceae bacterium]